MKAQSLPLNDDSTVTSSSSLFSESTGRSLQSLVNQELVDCEVGIRFCTGTFHVSRATNEKRKRVGFTTVEVRKYAVVLGDNPDASYPITLDWAHTKSRKMPINDFDVVRIECPARLTVDERIERLRKMGFSNTELRTMERDRKMSLLKEWEQGLFDELEDRMFAPPPSVCTDRCLTASKF